MQTNFFLISGIHRNAYQIKYQTSNAAFRFQRIRNILIDNIFFELKLFFYQTSNLNLLFPTIPQRTVPVWMPTLMLTDSCRSSSNSRIAEIIDRPISTQFFAWSGRGSGQPGLKKQKNLIPITTLIDFICVSDSLRCQHFSFFKLNLNSIIILKYPWWKEWFF